MGFCTVEMVASSLEANWVAYCSMSDTRTFNTVPGSVFFYEMGQSLQ